VFVPSTPARSRRGLKVAAFVLSALIVVALSAVMAWPRLRGLWHREPADPVVATASAYLKALVAGDQETIRKLGTVDLPPAIRSFRDVTLGRREAVRGKFGPIAALHAHIDEAFTFDPALGRYKPKNELAVAAEVLDTLHGAKAEANDIAKKIERGSPDDLFDAAEALAKPLASLAEGALAPKKLLPTYAMLVDDAKPPLSGEERALAKDYGDHRATWDALLGRPFATLRADGPFVLERAEVSANVVDALGSAGDPPTPLRLTLTRFRLEGIDTGWRVTSARRDGGERLDTGTSASKNP
jgi:hypothetical protein